MVKILWVVKYISINVNMKIVLIAMLQSIWSILNVALVIFVTW